MQLLQGQPWLRTTAILSKLDDCFTPFSLQTFNTSSPHKEVLSVENLISYSPEEIMAEENLHPSTTKSMPCTVFYFLPIMLDDELFLLLYKTTPSPLVLHPVPLRKDMTPAILPSLSKVYLLDHSFLFFLSPFLSPLHLWLLFLPFTHIGTGISSLTSSTPPATASFLCFLSHLCLLPAVALLLLC